MDGRGRGLRRDSCGLDAARGFFKRVYVFCFGVVERYTYAASSLYNTKCWKRCFLSYPPAHREQAEDQQRNEGSVLAARS